jgi:hypothetical protein
MIDKQTRAKVRNFMLLGGHNNLFLGAVAH